MRAKFIGDPRYGGEGPNEITFYGVTFPKGEWVEPIPEALEAKLPGNNHFLTDDGKSAVVVPTATDRYVLGTPSLAERAVIEAPVEPTSEGEKEALVAALEDLNATFDRRWGVTRLKAALEAAKFERGDD